MATTTMNHHINLYNQSLDILNSNPLFFITISLLFLPLTITATLFFSSPDVITFKTLTLIIIILPTATAATSLITSTAHHIIHRTPPPISTLKSLSHSFTPLLSTIIAETIPFALLFTLIVFSPTAVTVSVITVGLGFLGFLKGVWGCSVPIAVLESKYGFGALRESVDLLNKFRRHSFMISLFAVYFIGVLFWTGVVANNSEYYSGWVLVVDNCAICLQANLMITQYVVMNTVLYVQCKVARGEEVVLKSDIFDGDRRGIGFSCLVNFLLIVWMGAMFAGLL